MHIVLFDVDGTLTDSCEMDDACYLRAIRDVFGIDNIVADWSTFENSTDRGIAAEMIARAHCRTATEEDLLRFQTRFMTLIDIALRSRADSCGPIAGGPQLIQQLGGDDDFAIGIATGGFRETAELKLRHAAYEFDGLPFASGSDAISRRQIIQIAIDRTRQRTGGAAVDTITYVGDGVWDLRTAAAAGVSFIGVGCGPKADRLQAEGASLVLRDFSDPQQLLDAIARRNAAPRV